MYPATILLLKPIQFLRPSFFPRRTAYLSFAKEMTEKRLNRETDRKDFITYASLVIPIILPLTDTIYKILRHNDERRLSRQEILGNSRLLLTAGSETTATFLGGATYYLLQNPHVLYRVQSEVRAAFKNEAEITLRSISAPSSLPYLEAVIHESLRCYPPAPARMPRITGPEGAVINGKFVPGNVL